MEAVNIQNLGGEIANLNKLGKANSYSDLESMNSEFSSLVKGYLDPEAVLMEEEALVDNLLSLLNLEEELGEDTSLEDLSVFMENLLRVRENQILELGLGEGEKLEEISMIEGQETIEKSLSDEDISLLKEVSKAKEDGPVDRGDEVNFNDKVNDKLRDLKSKGSNRPKAEEAGEGKNDLFSLEKEAYLKAEKSKDSLEGQNFILDLKGQDEVKGRSIENISGPSDFKFMEDNIESLRENIIGSIDTLKDGEKTTIKVKLTPRELGEVDIDIKLENGKLVGRILVESSRVQEMFARNMAELTDNLNKTGTNFEEIEIDLKQNLSDFNDGNQGFQGREGARQSSQRNFINRLVKNKGISEISSLGLERKVKNPYNLEVNNLNILV